MCNFSHFSIQQFFLRTIFGLAVFGMLAGCNSDEPRQRAEDHAKRGNAYLEQGQYRAAMIEATNAVNAAPNDVQYRVALASMYNTIGSSRRASTLLEDVAADHPQETALVLAEAFLAQGRFLSARELLEQFQPENAEQAKQKSLFLADSIRVQGNLTESQQAYEALLQQYPDDPEVLRRLVENAILSKDLDAAQQRLDSWLAIEPKAARALRLQGQIAFARNQLERAERSLTNALIELPRSDIMLPERAAVLRLLSETLTAQGKMTEAMVYGRLLAEGTEGAIAARQRYNDALAALEAGEVDKAATLLKELLKENPNNQSAAIMLGVINLGQGDAEGAEALLSSYVDVETAATPVIRATVMAQAEVGDAEQALVTLDRAIQARPQDVMLLSMHGILALSVPERQRQGYHSLQKALSIEPHHSRLRLALARYHHERGEREQAMAQLRTAFKYQPADWAVTDTYINLLVRQQRFQELDSVIAELKTAAPKAMETELYEAQLVYRKGDRNTGLQQMTDLLKRNPGYAHGHFVVAQMQLEGGDPQAALASIEQVIELDPANLQPLRGAVGILSSHDLGQTPQDWLRKLSARHADNPELTRNSEALQAMLFRESGELSQAAALVAKYSGTESAFVRQVKAAIYRDQSLLHARQGNLDQAREHLGSALQLLPDSKPLNLDLVRIELLANRYSEAYALLDNLETRYPQDPELITVRAGGVRAEKGDKAAYTLLSNAWQERPFGLMAPLLINLASTQDPTAIPAILERWAEIDPDSRARMLHTANWYQEKNDHAAAIEVYEQILADNPRDAIALNNLAWLLKDTDLSRATAYAKSASELQPDTPAILDTYGWLLHLQGRNKQALEYLERAVQLAPNTEDIRKNRDIVKAML